MTAMTDQKAASALAEDFGKMAAMGAQITLGTLLAEMQALSAILPYAGSAASPDAAPSDLAEQEAIESGFDNMPV